VLLGEPPRTQGDLNFSLFGIPVRVHPFFWLVGVLLGWNSPNLRSLLIWIAALFGAILIHELGHALAMRRYGFSPWITLYGLGGLTSYNQSQAYRVGQTRSLDQILISAAGPGAGFLLAAVVIGVVGLFSGELVRLEVGGAYLVDIGLIPVRSPVLAEFIWRLLFISIVWGIVNLLPVYPLDGGQIARELLQQINPSEGIRWSLILSTVTALALALIGLTQWRSLLAAMFFGYLAYSSYATLLAYSGRGPRW